MSLLPLLLLLLILTGGRFVPSEDLTIDEIQSAFKKGTLTSRQLVEHYAKQIEALNPVLRAVIELNPDALTQADKADQERLEAGEREGLLHGIPVLVKDNIATRGGTNTTAGSLALVGSTVRRDAGVVERLRRAGAVVLGKASMSEWMHFRSFDAPDGWSARGGRGRNPYVLSADPCGSSSGSAIAVAANMVTVSLGTETDGSIICPSAANSVVGIKPTVGLTSRAGVIPVSLRQDTVGPICRTVSDAVRVLEAIVGFDERDAEATGAALKYIPREGYRQFLKSDGLRGKRVGLLRNNFLEFPHGSIEGEIFEEHFDVMRKKGAILVDNLEIENVDTILDGNLSGETLTLLAEFKISLNAYLSDLSLSPMRSLLDIILFNNKHSIEERIEEYSQPVFLEAQNTSGLGPAERRAIAKMAHLSKQGLERLMIEKQLDAVVTADATFTSVLAIGGYPGISVPAGYRKKGVPFGICFGGLKGSEPKLIEIAYGFEQATKARKQPMFEP